MDKDTDVVYKRVEWLHSEQCSSADNTFGEPQKTTRVGHEYQALIPALMTENERSQLMKLPVCEFGLSIPVTWVHSQDKNKEETMGINACPKDASYIVGCDTDNEESWSAIEHDSFILGLYIFGKNLRVVNMFIGNKGMPNVLCYYYGKFYRSNEHQKWSMYRKKRISKSLPGKKIFNGWRLHELLSRLLSNVTDECKASLTQVIRTFEEGKLPFEKYVFILRDTMGLDLLVQAVAIGKGKQDLTINTPTRLRSKKVESTCSSLKTEEIVNILKDRIGLSKVRLNEFFWAAVWPRLLARGWHYEQARNYAFQNSKNLVFLAPGVTKFSRRNLVKGSQYFDSLIEVLNKVASEPHLLEHEPGKDRLVEPHETYRSDDEQDLLKCTVVDTSFVPLVKVRELTSLTVFEPADMQASASVFGETEHDIAEESSIEDVNLNRVENTKMGPRLDDDNKSSFANSNKTDSLTPLANGQRQSRRNRSLTKKALEALEIEFMNPKKKRIELEDGTRRHVHAKMGRVSSCGARYLVDGVFDGSSHMVTESPK
ncbi:putative transcription regulator Homeodomain-LIKE family [Helianthus annuus]|nr:putative transcription regulator Homeodomain-LIKE family [Helianthus annuus]